MTFVASVRQFMAKSHGYDAVSCTVAMWAALCCTPMMATTVCKGRIYDWNKQSQTTLGVVSYLLLPGQGCKVRYIPSC